MSSENISSGWATKNGPTTVARSTACPPASITAARWASASWRDARLPSARSGCGTGRSAPRSGQVPTTTSVPSSRRCSHGLLQVAHRVGHLDPVGDVVAAHDDDCHVARRSRAGSAASCPASIEDSEPTTATVWSRTARPVALASRLASWAPSVFFGDSAPSPAAIESPTSRRSMTGSVLLLVGAVGDVGVLAVRLADRPPGQRRLPAQELAEQAAAGCRGHGDDHQRSGQRKQSWPEDPASIGHVGLRPHGRRVRRRGRGPRRSGRR